MAREVEIGAGSGGTQRERQRRIESKYNHVEQGEQSIHINGADSVTLTHMHTGFVVLYGAVRHAM